jgi:hypothetical protein
MQSVASGITAEGQWMRTPEELERVAFKETLTPDEDDRLVDYLVLRSEGETEPKKRTSSLKQAAFFAARAFDKGSQSPERLAKYIKLLTHAQRVAPTDSSRRKLAEMKSVGAGKSSHGAALKTLARKGEAGSRNVLATDAQLDTIAASLRLVLPESYRQ